MERIYLFTTHNLCFLLCYTQMYLLLKYFRSNHILLKLKTLGNGLVVITTIKDVIWCMRNNMITSELPTFNYTDPLIISLYLHECIRSKSKLRYIYDNSFTILGTYICYLNNSKAMCVYNFYCNGYPDFVDNGCLVLLLNRKLSGKNQKFVSEFVDGYMRRPGAAITALLILQNTLMYGNVNEYSSYATIAFSLLIYASYAVDKRFSLLKLKLNK